MGFHVKLFPFPVQILKQLSIAIGKNEINRLIKSLKVDINHTKEKLNWKPPMNVIECMKRMFENK